MENETIENFTFEGIVLCVKKNKNGWSVTFSNAAGSYENLKNAPVIKDYGSKENAVTFAKDEIHSHKWKIIETSTIFDIHIRKAWEDNKWLYIVKSPYHHPSEKGSGFDSREIALQKANEAIEEKLERQKTAP